jgi:methyl-accepting chemotaxis protein
VNLEETLNSHAEWKEKFIAAIRSREQLDSECISSERHCQLGRWLLEEASHLHGPERIHMRLVQTHTAFHLEADRVARLINDQQYETALAQMSLASPLALASHAVYAAITLFFCEVGNQA